MVRNEYTQSNIQEKKKKILSNPHIQSTSLRKFHEPDLRIYVHQHYYLLLYANRDCTQVENESMSIISIANRFKKKICSCVYLSIYL